MNCSYRLALFSFLAASYALTAPVSAQAAPACISTPTNPAFQSATEAECDYYARLMSRGGPSQASLVSTYPVPSGTYNAHPQSDTWYGYGCCKSGTKYLTYLQYYQHINYGKFDTCSHAGNCRSKFYEKDALVTVWYNGIIDYSLSTSSPPIACYPVQGGALGCYLAPHQVVGTNASEYYNGYSGGTPYSESWVFGGREVEATRIVQPTPTPTPYQSGRTY